MTISEYQSLILKARDNHLQISKNAVDKLVTSLEQAYNGIESLIAGIDGDPRKTVQRRIWKLKKRQLFEIAEDLKNGYVDAVREGMSLTTLNAQIVNQMAESAMLSDVAIEPAYNMFAIIPTDAVEAVWRRIGSDGLTLSKRIWKLENHLRRRVDAIVLSGIARGQSAVDMAKEIQRDILGIGKPEDIPRQLRWTTGIKKSVTGRGSIHYNALRLARTEIGNAYHEADIKFAMVSTVIKGIKWNLSPMHGIYDICDQLAGQDAYGLGVGVYPPENAPLIPHANDMCFTTREIRPKSEWNTPRETPDIRKSFSFTHPKTSTYLDSTRKKQITRKLTPHYKRTVERQFEAMMENIVGARRFHGIE